MQTQMFSKRDLLLASGGLVINLLGFLIVAVAIASPDPLHTANLVLALAAWLPAAITGTIACLALLQHRRWGMVLALVAIGLQLVSLVPYAIVRAALLADSRGLWVVISAVLLVAGVLSLVYWAQALGRRQRQ
jgi:hypothetical protein